MQWLLIRKHFLLAFECQPCVGHQVDSNGRRKDKEERERKVNGIDEIGW